MARDRTSRPVIVPAIFAAGLAFLATGVAGASPQSVGSVSWHPARYVSKQVEIRGYVLAVGKGFALMSDEAGGKVSAHDLPVTGPGVDAMKLKGRYLLSGRFVRGHIATANGNPYHLELVSPPRPLAAP